MLIRSQDRVQIVNLNYVCSFYIEAVKLDEATGQYITDIVFHTGHLRGTLVRYSSEEKATKVLDMIQSAYKSSNIKGSNWGYVKNTVFEMPSDVVEV